MKLLIIPKKKLWIYWAEWSKNSLPLGKGFSFHICQVYQGKVLIR